MSAKRAFLFGYVALLVASGIWKTFFPAEIPPLPHQESALVSSGVKGEAPVVIRYLDTKLDANDDRPVLVLLHGSPMASGVFDNLRPALETDYRLLVPDLPGFGRSQRSIPDYSIRAHSRYLESLLETLNVEESHLVGYSMGGGVALEFAGRQEERVASLTLVSSIGLQEYELLGDYTLNRALHAGQLFCLWAVDWLVPHFGGFERVLLNKRYARNFYDTDQRPLEQTLREWQKPVLIVHGDRDPLVPVEAARTHKALMPQAELRVFEGAGHLMIERRAFDVALLVSRFAKEVESGEAIERIELEVGEQVLAAPVAYQRNGYVMAVLLGVATFASEDLACIGGGLLASRDAIPLWLAIVGCLLGIFVGDFAIYLMGRVLGRPALKLPVIRNLLSEQSVERYGRWFDRKGLAVVIGTRFVPGSRVPTYLAAGIIKASPLRFAFALFFAAAIWTPALVGLSYLLGGAFVEFFEQHEGIALLGLLVSTVSILILARLGVALATRRGRRLLYSRWLRLKRWEFWPMWLFYPPVVVFILGKMIRRWSATSLTVVNPCMPESGLVFESKGDILAHLQRHDVPVGRFEIVRAEGSVDAKIERVERFLQHNGLGYPLALKPDMGQRGQGVTIARSASDARAFFEMESGDAIAQEFLSGREFGIFYYRYPGREKGRILSITDKRFVSVTGDGESTLEELILADERAVGMARYFLDAHGSDLDRVILNREVYPLTDLGTHCRGALFLDGAHLLTRELEAAVDAMSRGVEGFHFGRYDIRVPSEADLKAGRNIRVIELNGLTSESTHIYDPKHGLGFAYRALFRQYRIAFEIADEQVQRGETPAPLRRVASLFVAYLAGKGPPKS